jgi:hypothetical protein
VRKEIAVGEIEDDECMEDGMGRYHVFFSRERRFVSSYFLLASLNNSLPLFYFILLMLSLFFFLVQPSIYKQSKFVIFNRLVSSKLGDQVNPIIIWSLNFFLFTFVPFVQFNFLILLYFDFFEKQNQYQC